MKAETLLTLLKKCVLCLFLLVDVSPGFAQEGDTTKLPYKTDRSDTSYTTYKPLTVNDTPSSKQDTTTTPISEEGTSFWDDTLQPILVTAGAAAVIALFFFVKF